METSAIALEAGRGATVPATEMASDYWDALIDETPAADFLGVTNRSMQKWRQRGDGPPYVRISSRCVRYTRRKLKRWADSRERRSTSDPGQEAA